MKRILFRAIVVTAILSLLMVSTAAAADVTVYQDQAVFTALPGVEVVPIPAVDSQPYKPWSQYTGYSCQQGSTGLTLAGGAITVKEAVSPDWICIIGPAWNAGSTNINPIPDGPTITANGEDDYQVTINFTDPVLGVGFRLLTNKTAAEQITLSFADGTPPQVFGDAQLDTLANSFEFVGFKSSHAITQVKIDTTGGATQNEGIAGIWVIKNLPPTANAGGPYSGYVGESVPILGTAADPDGDPLQVGWSVNSADCKIADPAALSTSLTCYKVGAYTLTLRVSDGPHLVSAAATVRVTDPLLTDDVGDCTHGAYERYNWVETKFVTAVGSGTYTPTVSSTSLQPALTYLIEASGVFYAGGSGVYDIRADAKYTQDAYQRANGLDWTDQLRGYVPDGPSLLELKVDDQVVDWGRFNESHRYTLTKAGNGEPVAFQFQIKETYAQNNAGGLCVSIYEYQNDPPAADPGGPYSGSEGSAVNFNGTGSSDPDGDSFTFAWNFGDGGTSSDASPSHTYADNGTYDVCVTVQDAMLASSQCTTATIDNLAPALGAITVEQNLVAVNTPVNASADFTDPGILDTHTAVWEWGDTGTSAGTVMETNGSGTASGSHTYTTPGVYTVRLIVTDKDGASAESIYEYVVVYDPAAGFVTGGGWIDSPAGAYAANPDLSGKATFGFVSKYAKGASVPSGNTEFQFKAGDLNFKSTSYEWLVVNQAGANAQFKGTGTINGTGAYKFMIWAGDGTPDTFRIRIWEEVDGVEISVYDNGVDQPIGGGSIVVHRK